MNPWTSTCEWEISGGLYGGFNVTPIINGVRLPTHWFADRISVDMFIDHDRTVFRLVHEQVVRDMAERVGELAA